jgi:hypothetical protein
MGCAEEGTGSNGNSEETSTNEAQNECCWSQADSGGYAEAMGRIQGKEGERQNIDRPNHVVIGFEVSIRWSTPGMLLIDAIRILEDRYGIENIEHHPTTGDVVIFLPEREGAEIHWPYVFTDCQAKYLAVQPIPNEDIRKSRFPPDWPPGRQAPSAQR